MVRIRLLRTGRKGRPHYRIVVADARRKRDGKFIEILGHWHPLEKKKYVNKEKIMDWIKKGAQLSEAVQKILKMEEIIE